MEREQRVWPRHVQTVIFEEQKISLSVWSIRSIEGLAKDKGRKPG